MPIDQRKLERLLERIRDANHRTLGSSASDLFRYVDSCNPQCALYADLQADRTAKWAKWGPDGLRRWTMPSDSDERLSLTWDLYRSIAGHSDGGTGLLHMMYAGNFDLNVAEFNGDFFSYLVEILEAIVNADPSLKPLGTNEREKHQKFGILDAPQLLSVDLLRPAGVLGRAVIFLDLDAFKSLNERFTERLIDRAFLPQLQEFIARVAESNGFAYAEGGDEMIVLLPNASRAMAIALASELRKGIASLAIQVDGVPTAVSASLGLAWQAAGEGRELADNANLAKRHSKHSGKNCVSLYSSEGSTVVDPEPTPA